MATALKDCFVSLEDYFALDSASANERWEWRNGDVYCMTGAQPEHNLCCTNLLGELRARLRGTPCRTFPSDQRVRVHAGSPYLYPDVSVACRPEFATINGLRTLVNPVLIVEVLSTTTAADDRGAKFMQYQTIATLTDYLLVDSNAVSVLHFRKEGAREQGAVWTPRLYQVTGAATPDGNPPDGPPPDGGNKTAQAAVALPNLGISLPLAEIYLDTGLLGESLHA
jgi:Uma2 family endonuclease